jgi:D-lyxose ketol-isomerase
VGLAQQHIDQVAGMHRHAKRTVDIQQHAGPGSWDVKVHEVTRMRRTHTGQLGPCSLIRSAGLQVDAGA